MFVSHLYDFFGEMSVQFFCPFFDWIVHFLVLRCMSYLYTLQINSLSVVSFAIVFSHSEGCLFTLLIVSFVVQHTLVSSFPASQGDSDLLVFMFIVLSTVS